MRESLHPYDQLFPWCLPSGALLPLVAPVVETVFPAGTPRLVLYNQVSKIQDRDEWATRIVHNTVARLSLDDSALAQAAVAKGINAPECQTAFRTHWRGFVMAAAYPTQTIDFENYVLFAFILLQDTILIEQVKSHRNGNPGGWNLIRILTHHLVACSSGLGVRSLHTNANNPHSAALFEKNGFSELPTELFQSPVKFRKHLVRALPSAQ